MATEFFWLMFLSGFSYDGWTIAKTFLWDIWPTSVNQLKQWACSRVVNVLKISSNLITFVRKTCLDTNQKSDNEVSTARLTWFFFDCHSNFFFSIDKVLLDCCCDQTRTVSTENKKSTFNFFDPELASLRLNTDHIAQEDTLQKYLSHATEKQSICIIREIQKYLKWIENDPLENVYSWQRGFIMSNKTCTRVLREMRRVTLISTKMLGMSFWKLPETKKGVFVDIWSRKLTKFIHLPNGAVLQFSSTTRRCIDISSEESLHPWYGRIQIQLRICP